MKNFYVNVLTAGLIYVKKNLNQDQIDLYKMDKYVDAVHDILKKDNKKINELYGDNPCKQECFFNTSKVEDVIVASLNKDENIERIYNLTIGTMPWNVLEASLANEALKIIGLEKYVDGKGKVKLVAYSEENINQQDVVNAGISLVKKMKREA